MIKKILVFFSVLLLTLSFIKVVSAQTSEFNCSGCAATDPGTYHGTDANGNTTTVTIPPDATNVYSGKTGDGSTVYHWTDANGVNWQSCDNNGNPYQSYAPPTGGGFTLPPVYPEIPQIFPTSTPIPGPACGTNCADNPSICQQASGGCTVCGANGTCQAPPACGTPCNSPAACQGAQNGCNACVNGTCQQPPVCGADCTNNPNICNNIAGCNQCLSNPNGQGKTCQAPPVCGADCTSNPNICANIAGCNYCNPSSKKCEAAPTPTPRPVCGADCSQDPNVCNNISNCNYCNPGSKKCEPAPTATPTSTPVPTATPTPIPTATPTPLPFDASMCSCDGLNYTAIEPGKTTAITAYGKVLGINKNYAKIPSMTFTFYQSPTGSTKATILNQEKVNATLKEETAEKVMYQAVWNLPIPANIDTNQTYRIQAHPECSRKSAGVFMPVTTQVAGTTTTRQLSLWDRIAGFFANLLGLNSQPATSTNIPTPTPTLTLVQKKSLQIETFKPVDSSTDIDPADNCTFIKFSFKK